MNRVVALALVIAAALGPCWKKHAPALCADIKACTASCAPCRTGACKPEAASACRELGKLHLRSTPLDLAAAAGALDAACTGGDAVGCAQLALQVQDGRGVGWDLTRAAALYTKACDAGVGVGCFNLALMFNEGNGVTADRTKAETLMRRAEQEYIRQCRVDPAWCPNIGYLYENGMAGAADAAKAASFYQSGCDRHDPDSCVSLSLLELDGRGIPKDRAAALARLERVCKEGGALACGALARSLDEDPEKISPRAITLLEKGCAGGDAQSCSVLGGCLGLGRGVPEDDARALEVDDRACNLGDSLSCMALASSVEEPDPARASGAYLRACHYGRAEACLFAARLVVRRAVPGTPEDVKALVTRACSLGDADACSMLNGAPPR